MNSRFYFIATIAIILGMLQVTAQSTEIVIKQIRGAAEALSVTLTDDANQMINDTTAVVHYHFDVSNPNNGAETGTWEVLSFDAPAGFRHQFCDLSVCFPFDTQMQNFSLGASEGGQMKMSIYNYGNSGTANMTLEFRTASDPDNSSVFELTTVVNDVAGVGTNDLLELEGVLGSAYPNPVQDLLNFDIKDEFEGDIVISSIAGQELQRFAVLNSAGIQSIEVDGLSSGVYLYHLEGENTISAARKFIVSR